LKYTNHHGHAYSDYDYFRSFSLYSTTSKDSELETFTKDVIPSDRLSIQQISSNKIRKDVAIPYDQLTIGVLKETFKGERRVSQTPESVSSLVKAGFKVIVQSGGK
jgi:Alanine dehydrogenase/PNT, N-terminal domain